MKVTEQQVSHVASLARLQLSDDELRCHAVELARLLDHFEQLDQLDTDEVPPTAHVLALECRRRADDSFTAGSDTADTDDRSGDVQRLLQQAPCSDERFFVVPKVLDNE